MIWVIKKMRCEERYNIMTEEARGPGSEERPLDGAGLSECIQLGNFNSGSYEDEDELASWYATWRIPSMRNYLGVKELEN